MEIVVTVFATVVAIGCFYAILKSDLKEARFEGDSADKTESKP